MWSKTLATLLAFSLFSGTQFALLALFAWITLALGIEFNPR